MQQDYQQQLADKVTYVQDLCHDLVIPEIQVFASEPEYFRMRAEFRIWHEGDDCCYAMFERGQKASFDSIIRLETFPVACRSINDLMPRLLEKIKPIALLKNRLFQVEFLATLSGDMLVTLIYHRRLDDAWRAEAQALAKQLNIAIIGRSRGQKVVLERDFVVENLTVNEESFAYQQIEGGFTQPNANMCQNMLSWACDQASHIQKGDMLELYCGNGNFTLPLSRHFNQVLATEVSKTSVQAAKWNIEKNQINNIAIARLSAEEFTEAYQQERGFRRLEEASIRIQDYDFSTIFVDPPRAGVDDETLKLVATFENVLYISCNPVTLHSNLQTLCQTHEIVSMALFDQFPFTHHIESGVWLRKKSV